MKTKSNFFSLLFVAVVLAFLTNCSGNKKEETAESQDEHAGHEHMSAKKSEPAAPQFQVEEAFQKQLAEVFTAYVKLKEAFVSSDASKVKDEASKTQQALSKVDMKLLSGAAHNDWMTHSGGIESSLKEIQASADIEVQRKSFSTLSDNLYKSIKAYGLGGATAYYEFCPMAFNDQGAFWLSDASEIRNPYFGDEMLTCGEVKETLQ